MTKIPQHEMCCLATSKLKVRLKNCFALGCSCLPSGFCARTSLGQLFGRRSWKLSWGCADIAQAKGPWWTFWGAESYVLSAWWPGSRAVPWRVPSIPLQPAHSPERQMNYGWVSQDISMSLLCCTASLASWAVVVNRHLGLTLLTFKIRRKKKKRMIPLGFLAGCGESLTFVQCQTPTSSTFCCTAQHMPEIIWSFLPALLLRPSH